MAFNAINMAGMGQGQRFVDTFPWSSQYNIGRKPASELSPRSGGKGGVSLLGMQQQQQQQQQQQKTPKKGFPFDDEDAETGMYFSAAQSMFRADDKLMGSSSPSQLVGFGNTTLQQRGFSGQYQRNTTPTSMGAAVIPGSTAFNQQQQSPNRNVIGTLGQRNFANQTQITAMQKRLNPNSSGIISSSSASRFSLFVNLSHQTQTLLRSLSRSPVVSSTPSNAMTSVSGFTGFPQRSQDIQQPNFDPSEFPSLGNRTIAPPIPQRNYVGMVSKPATEQTPEFTIQQEDFPALPGAVNPPNTSAPEVNRGMTGLQGMNSYEQALAKDGSTGRFTADKSGMASKKGIQTHPDGTVSNIPVGMVTDQFGMVGLLTYIRAAETDPNLVALAPGIDLTTLGLNLNSPENLYSTFQSPWADSPCRPQDIDFHGPSEYLTNIYIRDKLAPIKLNRYGEDLLFFLFYMYGGDVLQLVAAAELYNRDWRYHKEERVWITRAPGVEPQVKTNSYERGTYYFFDPQNWRKVAKEFHLEYDKLEERPNLPSTLHHNPNQPAVLSH